MGFKLGDKYLSIFFLLDLIMADRDSLKRQVDGAELRRMIPAGVKRGRKKERMDGGA